MFFRSLCVGGLAGFIAAVLESLILGSRLANVLFLYTLIGALASGLSSFLLARWVGPKWTATVALGSGCVPLLWVSVYFVNTNILAGLPYSSPSSIALTSSVVTFILLILLILGHSRSFVTIIEANSTWPRYVSVVVILLTGTVLASKLPKQSHNSSPHRSFESANRLPNLALIILDSVRRDHVGLYGYSRPTTPTLDALEGRARVYENAFAASSWTSPSVHWILNASTAPLGSSLQKLLVDRGYVTGLFTDNPHLGHSSELALGFDSVERSVGSWRQVLSGSALGEIVERLSPGTDAALAKRATEWLRDVAKPWFLYVHLMDSHAPYDFGPIDGQRREGRRIAFPSPGLNLTESEMEGILARYDAGIRSADKQVGALVRAINEGTSRPHLLIITSDHGESLGEGDRWYHGGSLAPELLAVPLLVVGEGVVAGRVTNKVGFSSIARTFLESINVNCELCAGTDLRTTNGDSIVNGFLPPSRLYRISGRYKIIIESSETIGLYDLVSDPMEQYDLAEQLPEVATELSADLRQVPEAIRTSGKDIHRLRSLGYIGE